MFSILRKWWPSLAHKQTTAPARPVTAISHLDHQRPYLFSLEISVNGHANGKRVLVVLIAMSERDAIDSGALLTRQSLRLDATAARSLCLHEIVRIGPLGDQLAHIVALEYVNAQQQTHRIIRACKLENFDMLDRDDLDEPEFQHD